MTYLRVLLSLVALTGAFLLVENLLFYFLVWHLLFFVFGCFGGGGVAWGAVTGVVVGCAVEAVSGVFVFGVFAWGYCFFVVFAPGYDVGGFFAVVWVVDRVDAAVVFGVGIFGFVGL